MSRSNTPSTLRSTPPSVSALIQSVADRLVIALADSWERHVNANVERFLGDIGMVPAEEPAPPPSRPAKRKAAKGGRRAKIAAKVARATKKLKPLEAPRKAWRVGGCDAADGKCSGDVHTHPCPKGCGYSVKRCAAHGGRSLGGAIGGHARKCTGKKRKVEDPEPAPEPREMDPDVLEAVEEGRALAAEHPRPAPTPVKRGRGRPPKLMAEPMRCKLCAALVLPKKLTEHLWEEHHRASGGFDLARFYETPVQVSPKDLATTPAEDAA